MNSTPLLDFFRRGEVAHDIRLLAARGALAPRAHEQLAMLGIAGLSIAQRIALAMKGTREERAILIRDPNKIVAVAVLSSPKLTETEVESIAKMANVSEEILRIIGHTRAWVKNYTVMLALDRKSVV